MPREVLPNRRKCHSFPIEFQGEHYVVTVGYYPDGRIGELFIDRIRDRVAAKIGTVLDGVCRDSAIILSIALQHSAQLGTIRHAVTRDEDGTPATIVGAILDHLSQEPPDDHPNTAPEPRPPSPDPSHTEPTRDNSPTTGASGTEAIPPTPLGTPSGREREREDLLHSYTNESRN